MNGVSDAGTGVPAMPPPPMAPGVLDASALAAAQLAAGSLGAFPNVDNLQAAQAAQAYAQMLSYFQQAQAYAGLAADPSGAQAAPFGAAPFGAAPPLPNYAAGAQPPSIPTIAVAVEGMKFQYQLTEDDLQKVFSRYGSVRQIR